MRGRVALVGLLLAACQPAPPREVPRPPTKEERQLPSGDLRVLPSHGGSRTSASSWSSEHDLLLTAERDPAAVRLWDGDMVLRASFEGTFAPGSQPWRPDSLEVAVLVEVGMERPEVSVRIIDVRSGRAQRSWVPRDWKYLDGAKLSWSGTGTMILLEGGSPSLLVVDVSDGHTVTALDGRSGRWCPDSKPLLASTSADGKVTVRDLREDLVFEAPGSVFAWEPGCERLALLQANGELRLWTPGADGAPTVIGDHDEASHVVFSPSGDVIATVGNDVRLWGRGAGESRGRLDTVPTFARPLASFSRDGARFGAYDDAGLGVWQVDVARRVAALPLSADERGPFEIVGDDVFLVSAGRLQRWQVTNDERQVVARGSPSAPTTALFWSKDDSKLALVRGDGVTRVVDLAGASAIQQTHPSDQTRATWLSERGFSAEPAGTGGTSLQIGPNGSATIRDAKGDGALARFAAPVSGDPAAALRPDQGGVALRAWDGTVRIYELTPFRLVGKLIEAKPASGLVWHPNGELLLIEGQAPSLRNGADGSLVRRLGDQRAPASWGQRDRDRLDVLHGDFSPDGCVLHTFGHGSQWLRDARSGQRIADFDFDGQVGPLAWAHNHGVLAVVTEDGDVLLWRTHDGRRLTLHAEETTDGLALVAFTDDGLWAGDSRAAGATRFVVGDDLLSRDTVALSELPLRQHLPTLAGDFVEGRQLDFP